MTTPKDKTKEKIEWTYIKELPFDKKIWVKCRDGEHC